jgi:hypothetical protein
LGQFRSVPACKNHLARTIPVFGYQIYIPAVPPRWMAGVGRHGARFLATMGKC